MGKAIQKVCIFMGNSVSGQGAKSRNRSTQMVGTTKAATFFDQGEGRVAFLVQAICRATLRLGAVDGAPLLLNATKELCWLS